MTILEKLYNIIIKNENVTNVEYENCKLIIHTNIKFLTNETFLLFLCESEDGVFLLTDFGGLCENSSVFSSEINNLKLDNETFFIEVDEKNIDYYLNIFAKSAKSAK